LPLSKTVDKHMYYLRFYVKSVAAGGCVNINILYIYSGLYSICIIMVITRTPDMFARYCADN
jgi:hypothetical protein